MRRTSTFNIKLLWISNVDFIVCSGVPNFLSQICNVINRQFACCHILDVRQKHMFTSAEVARRPADIVHISLSWFSADIKGIYPELGLHVSDLVV